MEAENARLGALREAAFPLPADFEDQLVGFGEATMNYLTAGAAVDFYSVLVGELRRHPDLARTFYEVGPGHTHLALTGVIQGGIDAGQVSVEDPAVAAEELFGMWQGFSNFQLSLGFDQEAVRAAARQRVRSSVRAFLVAHPVAQGTAQA
jgi:TetR/AcrR family transcriptional repressor of mexJK operon